MTAARASALAGRLAILTLVGLTAGCLFIPALGAVLHKVLS